MTPEVDALLKGSFMTLVAEIAPQLQGGYQAGSAGAIGALLYMAAGEYDRAADLRVSENQEMRALFSRAAGVITDAPLVARLTQEAQSTDSSLKISALNDANNRLSALLIDLQVHLEKQADAKSADLEMALLAYLANAAECRKLPHPSELLG